jgi:hypothetical protein
VIRELAENANTHTALGPDEERIVDDRWVVWLGRGDNPWSAVVQRLRLAPEDVGWALGQVRGLLRARGRTTCTWEIADTATPADLVERLLDLGLVRDAEPLAIGMVLDAPPADDGSDVEARRVRSREELVVSLEIAAAAFEAGAAALEEQIAAADASWAAEGHNGATFVALVDGRPVARAYSAYTPHGVLLFGGATLADARGRGAYRALVRARWEDAAARGTPVLVTHAGAMSRPILARLGFREVSRIAILRDDFGP